jgi:hypothetical protein
MANLVLPRDLGHPTRRCPFVQPRRSRIDAPAIRNSLSRVRRYKPGLAGHESERPSLLVARGGEGDRLVGHLPDHRLRVNRPSDQAPRDSARLAAMPRAQVRFGPGPGRALV